MPEFTEILYEVAPDRVATLTLNRPDKLNAWTFTMEREVHAALDAAAADDDVRAVIITGAGRGFCAGADLDNVKEALASGQIDHRPRERAAAGDDPIEANYTELFGYLLRLPKPIVAAINGPVAGIGLALTLCCDIRFIAEGAKVSTAFARRGLIAEHGMSWLLPRIVGLQNALDLLFSGRVIDAAEAARIDLAKLLPAAGFQDAVRAVAVEYATLSSPRSIAVMKRQVYDGLLQDLGTAWRIANVEMRKSFQSEDFREGIAHFFEKRPPNFTGR